jgi:hypothetical protein
MGESMNTVIRKENLKNMLLALMISLTPVRLISQDTNMNMPANHSTNIIYVKHQMHSPDAWQGKNLVYTSIQEAIGAASNGNEIWVAKGWYQENVELKKGIHIFGGFEGNETAIDQRGDVWNDIAKTTIDARNNGRCMLAASNTAIDGFKLVKGREAWGAGIGISNSTDIEVRNVMIQDCQANWAGSGILVDSPRQDGKILIDHVIIWKCDSYCGALEITETTSAAATVSYCTIVKNRGKGLEIPFHDGIVPANNDHNFYNNIVWDNYCPNYPDEQINIWCWARNHTDYSYIANKPWNAVSNKWEQAMPHNLFESEVGPPEFVDADQGDFRLKATSPCIGAGMNGADIGAMPFKISVDPILNISSAEINFDQSQTTQNFTIKNMGRGVLSWQLSTNVDATWIASINPSVGNLNTGECQEIRVTIDRNQLTEDSQTATISIKSNAGDQNVTVNAPSDKVLDFAIRVNCGCPENYTDSEGNIWEADRAYSAGDWGYIGGRTYSTSHPIYNTKDDLLYQTERWGLEAYKFDVENGDYDVTLLFAEIYFHAPGKRSFHLEIEGNQVLSDYDIFNEVGHDDSTSKSYQVKVFDNQLNINFISDIEDPKVAGIQIMRKNIIGGMVRFKQTLAPNQLVLVPNTFKLYQNYPNPFNASTTITFELPEERYAQLNIYNVTGQIVYELLKESFPPGRHYIVWNGVDRLGRPLKSGNYFCRLNAGEFSQTIKMSLLK